MKEVVGWGESITQFKESTAAATLITGLSEFVIGQNPMNNAATPFTNSIYCDLL